MAGRPMGKLHQDDVRAYQLAKAYQQILKERGVTGPWVEVMPTRADIDLALIRIQDFKS